MKKTNSLLTLLYLVSLIASVYALYQLPISLMESQVIDLAQLKQAQPVFDQLYLVIGVSLAFGAAAVVGLWMERRETGITNTVLQYTEQAAVRHQQDEEERGDEAAEASLQIEGIDEIVANEKNEEAAFTKALSLVCCHTEASQAAAYRVKCTEEYSYIELFASFAYHAPEGKAITYRFGEGLAGQVAKQGECVNVDTVPEGYIKILSGLGKATPTHLIILPVKHNDQVVGVVEIASFKEFSTQQERGLQLVFDQLALKLSNNNNVSLEKAAS